MNLLVELVGNYPPMPLVTQKNGSFFSSRDPPRHISLLRLLQSATALFWRPTPAAARVCPPPPTPAAAIHPSAGCPSPAAVRRAPPNAAALLLLAGVEPLHGAPQLVLWHAGNVAVQRRRVVPPRHAGNG